MPTHIAIRGQGAVSPAGWGADALTSAALSNTTLPTTTLARDGKSKPAVARRIPKPDSPLPSFRDPRLRRTSSIGRYGVAAALEALGDSRGKVESGALRTGVIFCEMNGIVEYSRRFYEQVRENPAFASPILFPETVYNAPSSHLSALLGSPEINYTILGNSAQFISGLDLAAHWLSVRRVEACLVVAAEELDWLSAEAVQLFDPATPVTEGAAALFLERVTDPQPGEIYLSKISPPLLNSPLNNSSTTTESELQRQPLRTTGTAFSVNAGWQAVHALHLFKTSPENSTTISNQNSFATFTKYGTDPLRT